MSEIADPGSDEASDHDDVWQSIDGGQGQTYAWENTERDDYFWGTPAELSREIDGDEASLRKVPDDDYPSHRSYNGWEIIDTPNPGSDTALALGGTCPVLDNSHGEGYMGTDRYIVTAGCPLHDDRDERWVHNNENA